MQTLQVSNDKARQLYPTASQEWKQILEDSFPKGFFDKKTGPPKTFEEACEINGTDPTLKKFTEGDTDSVAYEKLKEVAKALRKGKVLDYRNSEAKWYPVHHYTASGFRFGDSFFGHSIASAPARLCVSSNEDSDYFGKQFIDLFEQYKN